MAERVDNSENGNDGASASRKRYRTLLLFLGLVLLTPSAISWTGQADRVVSVLNPKLADSLQIGTAELHWWSPIRLSQVRLRDQWSTDSDDTTLVSIDAVESQKPLWKLALSGGRDCRITVTRPALNLKVDGQTTNLEVTLNELFGRSDQKTDFGNVTIQIVDGEVRLADKNERLETSRVALVGPINGSFSTAADNTFPTVNLTAMFSQDVGVANRKSESDGTHPRVAAALEAIGSDAARLPLPEQATNVTVDESMLPHIGFTITSGEKNEPQTCSVRLKRISLRNIEPLLQRLLPNTHWRGTMSGQLDGVLPGNSSNGSAGRIRLKGDDIRMRADSWAPGESLDLEDVAASGAFALAPDGIFIQDLSLASSVFELTGRGEIQKEPRDPVATLKQIAADRTQSEQEAVNAAVAASQGHVQLKGRVDVAAVSQMLPKTLHISEAATLSQGDVKIGCRINTVPTSTTGGEHSASDRFQWQLVVQSSPFEVTGDRTVTIDSKIHFEAAGLLSATNVNVQRAVLNGTFGQVDVGADDGEFTVDGHINPSELWQQFDDLIDIPPPQISGNVDIFSRVRSDDGGILFQDLSVESSAFSVDSRRLVFRPEAPILRRLDGELLVTGTAGNLKAVVSPWLAAKWLSDQSDVRLHAVATDGMHLGIDASITPTGHADEPGIIDEGKLLLDLQATDQPGTFQVSESVLQLPGLVANVSGVLRTDGSEIDTDLTVNSDYDLSQLSAFGFGEHDKNFHAAGRHRSVFQVNGNPFQISTALPPQSQIVRENNIPPLSVSGPVSWDSIDVWGVKLGPCTVQMDLTNGLLRTSPIDCSAGSGQLHVMPQFDIERDVLRFASGGRVENLEVTPELCSGWLGYVAPLLSDSTTVEGKLSARVQKAEWNFEDVNSSDVRGVISVHRANAGPGESLYPLLQVLELISKRSLTSRSIEIIPQDIAVAFRDGAVSHQHLEMEVAGYRVATSGSVTTNGGINLLLDVPTERSTEFSRGRSLQIPVHGTVGRPQLDVRGLLQNAGRQQIEQKLNKELDRGLNRLLDKLR